MRASIKTRNKKCKERMNRTSAHHEDKDEKCFASSYMFCMPPERPCMNFPYMLNVDMAPATLPQVGKFVAGYHVNAMKKMLARMRSAGSFLLGFGKEKLKRLVSFLRGKKTKEQSKSGTSFIQSDQKDALATKSNGFVSIKKLASGLRQALTFAPGDATVAAVKSRTESIVGTLFVAIPVAGPLMRNWVVEKLDKKLDGALLAGGVGKKANDLILSKLVPRLLRIIANPSVAGLLLAKLLMTKRKRDRCSTGYFLQPTG